MHSQKWARSPLLFWVKNDGVNAPGRWRMNEESPPNSSTTPQLSPGKKHGSSKGNDSQRTKSWFTTAAAAPKTRAELYGHVYICESVKIRTNSVWSLKCHKDMKLCEERRGFLCNLLMLPMFNVRFKVFGYARNLKEQVAFLSKYRAKPYAWTLTSFT